MVRVCGSADIFGVSCRSVSVVYLGAPATEPHMKIAHLEARVRGHFASRISPLRVREHVLVCADRFWNPRPPPHAITFPALYP